MLIPGRFSAQCPPHSEKRKNFLDIRSENRNLITENHLKLQRYDYRHSQRDQEQRESRGPHSGRRAGVRQARTHGLRPDDGRRKQRIPRRCLRSGRRPHPARHRGGLCRGRDDYQGEGAHRPGVQARPQGTAGIHLFPFRQLGAPHAGHDRERRRVLRLRNRRAQGPLPAAADPHVGGRRPHVHPGGALFPREAARRQRASCWAACRV